MYQNTPQISIYYSRTSTCIICVHLWNGNADTVEVDDDYVVFYEQQKARLINEFNFTPAEANKMIKLREQIADIFVDRWIEKSSHSISEMSNDNQDENKELHNSL